MEKMTFQELYDKIKQHNQKKGIVAQWTDKQPLKCCIVFKEENWKEKFPLESRTYAFRNDEKYFLPQMGGSSIFADSLDGSDHVRLDWYLNDWEIEYCYIA